MYPGTKYGGENPLTIHEIYAALTPSDSRSDWASEFAAAKTGRGLYKLKLKYVFPFIQCSGADESRFWPNRALWGRSMKLGTIMV